MPTQVHLTKRALADCFARKTTRGTRVLVEGHGQEDEKTTSRMVERFKTTTEKLLTVRMRKKRSQEWMQTRTDLQHIILVVAIGGVLGSGSARAGR